MDSNRVFAGVDFSAGRDRLTVAFLSARLDVRSIKVLSPEESLQQLASPEEVSVALGGPMRPASPEAGDEETGGATPRRGKRKAARAAETDLARRGIPVRRTPPEESAVPIWMRTSLRLAGELAARGFAGGREARESPRTVIETHPAAAAAVLLGRLPFGRETLEGRIQRQLALLRERVALRDPMDALEELTAHHILSGRLALEGILQASEMDALLAAYTAWRGHSSPDAVTWLGDDAGGWLCLPAKELLEKYSR